MNKLCWVCNSSNMVFFRSTDIKGSINSHHFKITDTNYGNTLNLVKCAHCDFIQACENEPILQFYMGMKDLQYEDTRESRRIQFLHLLQSAKEFLPKGSRILDVGAGSGIMVEVAIEMGYLSEGVEPSLWLSNIAQERGLPVYTGVLPSDLIQGKFDAITLFDVIEHVTDPIELIRNASSYLKSEGILFIVTPDVNSITAKLLKSKWWHFRIAHVGYFSNRSLNLLMEKCGFSRVKGYRPNWYFPTYYIFKRLTKYFPILARISLPKVITDTTLRVNFFDSIAVIYKLNDKKIKHTELY